MVRTSVKIVSHFYRSTCILGNLHKFARSKNLKYLAIVIQKDEHVGTIFWRILLTFDKIMCILMFSLKCHNSWLCSYRAIIQVIVSCEYAQCGE